MVYGSEGQSRGAGTLTPNLSRKFLVNPSQSYRMEREKLVCGVCFSVCTDHYAEHSAIESQLLSNVEVLHGIKLIAFWSRQSNPVPPDQGPYVCSH